MYCYMSTNLMTGAGRYLHSILQRVEFRRSTGNHVTEVKLKSIDIPTDNYPSGNYKVTF